MSSDPLTELGMAERARLEGVLVTFDLNWTPDSLAVAVENLPASGAFRVAAIREMVRIELERYARRGQRVSLQVYIDQFPELLEAGGTPADLLDVGAAGTGTPELHSRTRPPGQLPEQFGRYHILRPLGRGGMGSVYLARDTELDRLVALKVPHFRADDIEGAERFAEARAAATIDHPNVCRVYDVGRVGDTPFLTMAYVEGPSLADELQAGPLTLRRAAELARDIACALAEAHRHHVIHRDLKPGNILISRNGQPVVADFGLALRAADGVRMTDPGTVLGTPLYMSPEQISGDTERIGAASDVYSLGVVLYEMLTGQPPFTGSRTDVFTDVLTRTPEPPSTIRPEVDTRLDAITMKALAKAPGDRFANMAEFADALTAWLKDTSPRLAARHSVNRRLTLTAAAAIVLTLLISAAAKLGWFSKPENLERKPPNANDLTTPTSLYVGKISGTEDDRIAAVALTADGHHVHAGVVTKSWLIFQSWDAVTGEEKSKEPRRSLHGWVTFSADGVWYLVCGGLPQAEFGHVGSGRKPQSFPTGQSSRTGAISRNGTRVLAGIWSLKEKRETIGMWDVDSGKEVRADIRFKESVRCAALSGDGRWAFAASPDREAVWEVGAPNLTVDHAKNSSLCAVFAPAAVRVYVGSEYGRIQVYEPLAVESVRSFESPATDAINCLAVSPDERYVASGGDDGSVRIWDAAAGKEIWKLEGHTGRVSCVAFDGAGHRLVSAGADRTWRVWELRE